MKKNRNVIKSNTFNQKPILQIPMDVDILKKIDERLEDSLSRHSRVYAMRLDIKIPCDDPVNANKEFSKVNAHFLKKEKKQGYDPVHVTVRETSSNDGIHYHMLLILNGNKTRSTYPHVNNANVALNCNLGYPANERTGGINIASKLPNGTMISRSDIRALNLVFKQGSYLAKVAQKGATQNGQREIFATNLKRRCRKKI